MSLKLYCSLCFTPNNEFEPLQNENGEFNDIYKTTIKYFDPMFLKTEEKTDKYSQKKQVLCQNCWMPIKDFSEFQQNVIKTRSLLENTEVNPCSDIKVEYDEQENVITFQENIDNNYNIDDGDVDDRDNEEYSFENIYIKPDMNLEDDNENRSTINEDDDDDEKPLIILKNKAINNIEVASLKKQQEITTNEEDRKPQRRGRKPKQNKTKEKEEHKAPDTDQHNMQKKKLKLNGDNKNDKGKSALNLEKARESDAFIAKWKPVLECDLCEETSSSFDKLRSHFKEIHKTRFYIKCCERKFYRRYVLANHIQLHLNPDTHKCDICGKVSTCKNNLKLHKKLMHEEIEQLECEICHKLFNLKTSLDRHRLIHVTGEKNFACQQCGKAYVLEVQLKSHIKTVHNVDRVCDQCGKTIHGVQALNKHLMEHAGIKKIKFPCDECGVELNSRNSLKRHKAAFHHDGSTIYVCSICGKVAASASALLNHKKYVHEEQRKYKCSYCEKAFKRAKNLQEHIATHTGQDLYQCPHCPQTFKVSANMHHHRKKVHPIEWEEGRKNRLQVPKVDINHVKNQIVL